MVLTITLTAISLALSGLYAYLFYAYVGSWHAFIAIPLFIPTYIVLFLLWVAFFILWGKTFNTSKPHKPSAFYYWVLRDADYVLMFLLNIRIKVRGEHLPKKTRFALVCNHRSGFDPMIILKAIKQKPLIFVTKPENMKHPIAGPFIHHAGFVSVDRSNMLEGVKDIERAASYLKDRECSVGIFPEGTRNMTEEPLLPFHPGSFRLAQYGEAPLVIACLKGSEKIKHRAVFRRTKIYLDILEIIPEDEVASMSTHDLAAHAEKLILEDLQKKE